MTIVVMMRSNFSQRLGRDYIEEKCLRSLHVCNGHGLFNLPCRNENNIDVSTSGEYLLCSDKKCFCIINIQSQLYSGRNIRRIDNDYTCSCSRNGRERTSPTTCESLLTKEFSYRSKCAAALWHPINDYTFISGGDNFVNVWDVTVPEVAYTCAMKSSNVRKLGVSSGSVFTPIIAAGLSCGSIATCDLRSVSATNYISSAITGEVTALSFQSHNENLLVAGYEDATVAIWDLRRFNRPLTVLSNESTEQQEKLLNGCTVAYINEYSSAYTTELALSRYQDFADEEDVWSYVMGFDKTKEPKKDASFISQLGLTDMPRGSNKRSSSAQPAGTRTSSTSSITSLLLGPSNKGDMGSERSGSSRSAALERLKAKYLTEKRRRLYSYNDTPPIQNQSQPKPPKTASKLTRPLMSASASRSVKDRGIPTAVSCTKDGHSIFIARHKGFIEQYDAKNYRCIDHFMLEQLLQSYEQEPPKYAQHMSLMSWDDGDHLIFNVKQHLGVLHTRSKVLRPLVKLRWEGHDELVGNNAASQVNVQTTKEYVTGFTALRRRHEIYAINEAGEVFVLHPDRSNIVRQDTNNHKEEATEDKI